MTADRGRLGYRPALTGIRGVAILGVVAVHSGVPHMPGGGVGVDVFYALSGYLITSLLLREQMQTGRISFRRFYLRRCARLLPALFVMLGLTVAVSSGLGLYLAAQNRHALPIVLLYGSNWQRALHGTATLGWYEHTWSLSVEEQFYLVWPTLALIAARRGPKRVLQVALAGCAWASIVRLLLAVSHATPDRALWGTDAVMDHLLIGAAAAAAAAVQLYRPTMKAVAARWRWPAATWLAVVVASWPSSGSRWFWPMLVGGSPLVALASATLIVDAHLNPDGPFGRVLRSRPLVFVGDISYALYLWHVPLLFAIGFRGERALIAITLAFTAAIASTFLVERPIQRLSRRGLGGQRGQADREVSRVERDVGGRVAVGEQPDLVAG